MKRGSTSCNERLWRCFFLPGNGHLFRILRICTAKVGSPCGFDSLQFREIVEILVAMVGKAATHPSCQWFSTNLRSCRMSCCRIQLFSSTFIGRSTRSFQEAGI